MPQIGEAAPDFALPNQDGEIVNLTDYRGRMVILFAFPKADTPGCTAQACGFRDAFPNFEAGNAVVLGISNDSSEQLKKWKIAQKLPYDLLSDADHTVLDAFNAWGMSVFGLFSLPRTARSYWVIDENGIIIDGQVGISPSASVEKALAAVQNRQSIHS